MRIEQVRERNLLRANLAHWEVAELFQHLMPIALFEAKEAEDFEEFEAVLRPQIGEEASAWLPSLYLAVAASPTIHYDARMKMVLSVLPFVTDYSG